MAKHRAPSTVRPALALVALFAAFAALFAVLAPDASAASGDSPAGPGGRYPVSCAATGTDTAWVGHVVGCSTDLTYEATERLVRLRDSGCEGLRAGVPAATIVDTYAADLGDRRDAVTLFVAVNVWCYGG